MEILDDREFGCLVGQLIRRQDLDWAQARASFATLLSARTSDLQQGAFLAALCAKGETAAEVAGAWQAIQELDTVRLDGLDGDTLVENSGTGMDSYKTFNISTAAALVAAAAGATLARHGARALSSRCGTVDMAELLGVDVECRPDLVLRSIRQCRIGLFNGMSPLVHPGGLARILSQIHFGTTLNISASLANPARPRLGVRGVYRPDMLETTARVMRDIGYRRAFVLYGAIDGQATGMDEASVCGLTELVELKPDGELACQVFRPEDLGMVCHHPALLQPDEPGRTAAVRFLHTLAAMGCRARQDAVCLNAALVLQVAGLADELPAALRLARNTLESGAALRQLGEWVLCQNAEPDRAQEYFHTLKKEALGC